MLSARFRPYHVPLFAAKYAWLHLRRRPVLVHLEVTMRCNARCDFCDYWKTPAAEKVNELRSFADAARFFNPMLLCFTGGEPLLRRDLEDLVAAVSGAVRLKYITVITHGAMLTVERARSLWDAGINQFSISLDFLDERHDVARGIPGLAARILDTVPRLRTVGIDNVRFNTVIKDENLEHVMDIVRTAHELGVGVGLSTYTAMKNGNATHIPRAERLALVDDVVRELLAFKRHHRGVITSSDWYLRQIPRYLRGELRDPCASGLRTIHIDPIGFVRRCPDFPADMHWRDFKPYSKIDCNACFYACRGEAQAPLTLARLRDVVA
ncbi:MAG TPA: radical SAM protein [Gemmatimonadaceae bacterium]|nr:radical SAM protein [Gemmatimonadaceae bacterium]